MKALFTFKTIYARYAFTRIKHYTNIFRKGFPVLKAIVKPGDGTRSTDFTSCYETIAGL